MNSFDKFRRLSWRERGLLVQSLLLLPLTSLALRQLGLRRGQSALASIAPAGKTPNIIQGAARIRQAQNTAKIVRIAAAHGLYQANCLSQSLVLWCLLRRQGIESDLRIGTRKDAKGFAAHAWVEFSGSALNESDDVYSRYQAFDRAIEPAEAK